MDTELVNTLTELKLGHKTVVPRQPWKGRGIVMCGGGKRLFANGTVTIKLLRHWGCTLPIEWFYADTGEMTHNAVDYLETQYNVKCQNMDFYKQFKDFNKRGFQIKPLALLFSRFEEVIFVDSENLPLADPEMLFETKQYKKTGALFWKDYWQYGINDNHDHGGMKRIHELFGLPEPENGEFENESGQMVVHKSRHFHALQIAAFMALNYKIFQQKLIYGDKDTYKIAWKFCEEDYHVIDAKPGLIGYLDKDKQTFRGYGMIQGHPDSYPFWIHMTVYSWEEKTKPWNGMIVNYNNVAMQQDGSECFVLCYDKQMGVLQLTEKMAHTLQIGELFWKEIIVWEKDMLDEMVIHDDKFKKNKEDKKKYEKEYLANKNLVEFPVGKNIINKVIQPNTVENKTKRTINMLPMSHSGNMNGYHLYQRDVAIAEKKKQEDPNKPKPIQFSSL